MATRPNIVQIVADDMGLGDMSVHNGGLSSTPVLDWLVTESLSLTQHYSASPVCAPARAALLTGRYPQRGGVVDTLEVRGLDRLSLDEVTLAELLADAGYRTGLVGKWHTGAIGASYRPTCRGFAEFVGFRGGWQDYWDWTLEAGEARHSSDGRYLTDVLTGAALDFVTRNRAEPFYLHLAYNAPHFPFQAPAAEIERFTARGLGLGAATVYAMIAAMDRGIGRLLQTIEDLSLSSRTLVMFTSDNGPQLTGSSELDVDRFNSGLRGEKGLVYEGGIRVPMLLRWPDGLPSNTSTPAMVHFTDWTPTLLAAAGVSTPVNLDGRDIGPVLRGDREPVRCQRVWQWTRYRPHRRCNVAVRDGRWKLVMPPWPGCFAVDGADAEADARHAADPQAFDEVIEGPLPQPATPPDDLPDPQLFDLDADPGENNDVAASHPDRVRVLIDGLDAWYDDVFGQ